MANTEMTQHPLVYKYRCINFNEDGSPADNGSTYTMNFLQDGEVYFPNRNKLNDPYDARPTYNHDTATVNELSKHQDEIIRRHPEHASIYRQMTEDPEYGKYLIEGTLRYLESDESLSNMGIFSTSATYDDTLMWAHYANEGTGICIGLKTDIVSFHYKAPHLALALPFYKSDQIQQDKDFHDTFIETIGDYDYLQLEPITYLTERMPPINIFSDDPDIRRLNLLVKSQEWSYENEYRILVYLQGKKDIKLYLKEGVIDTIILGYNMPYASKYRICEMTKCPWYKCYGAKVYQLSRSSRDYGFELKTVPIP